MGKCMLFLALAWAASAQAAINSSVTATATDAAFNQLAEEYLTGYLGWRPQLGTSLGWHQYDGRISDFSRASLDAELARLRSFEQRLAKLDTAKLSDPAFYDYRILLSSIRRETFSFEDMQIYTQNPMTYAGAIDLNIYIKRNFAPLENRARSIIAILNQAPALMAAARTNLADSLPKPLVETAIEVASGAADFLSKDLVEALKDLSNPPLVAEFNTADQRAVRELRDYVNFLKQEKLPRANDHYALGREKYSNLLSYGLLVSISPEQVLKIGLRELQREQQVFAQTARRLDPTKPPMEVFRAIQKDHPTAPDLIPEARRDLETIRGFVVSHRIVTLPSEVRAQVVETPQYLRAMSFASMDTPGPFETKTTEAYYYITPTEPQWTPEQKEQWLTAFNYYTTDIVTIHEAYPGHYAQFLCLNASPATKLEKIFNNYAFVEGWAHYAEQMMLDEGFGAVTAASGSPGANSQAAKYRLAQSDEALLRICRLCVSVKMHCQGMSVEDAARFFQDNCYYEAKPAKSEAIRGTFDPEFLYYTVGKLEILKLRRDYRRQEGSAFNLQKFHDELLRHGAPPIRLLREILLKDRHQWDAIL